MTRKSLRRNHERDPAGRGGDLSSCLDSREGMKLAKWHSIEEYISANPPKPFKPGAKYFLTGDFLSVFFEGELYFAEQVDARLTVYRAESDRRVIGFRVWGIKSLIRESKE